VVDVRDDDWEGDCIKGSVNCPSADWDDWDYCDGKIEDWKLKSKIIFHCMLR